MELNEKDLRTVAAIVAAKAEEMAKKGAMWSRGRRVKMLSPIQVGKLANKILAYANPDEVFIFSWEKKRNNKRTAPTGTK